MTDPVLHRIARIVDEADTVQEAPLEPAAAGLDMLCRGIRRVSLNDDTALERAVFVIDMATMKEAGRIEGCSAPHVVKYGPLRNHAYVTCKKELGIAVIDPVRNTLLRTHSLNVNPRSLTFSPDESKVYFGSFWVDGFFELDSTSGKVARLFRLDPPTDNAAPQEVTYHGVEAVGGNIVLAANEGRSYLDAVDVATGALLDRLADVSKPCCIERIPGPADGPTRVLVSNLGDGTLQLVEVSPEGRLTTLGRAAVGQAPKRVAFPPNEPR